MQEFGKNTSILVINSVWKSRQWGSRQLAVGKWK